MSGITGIFSNNKDVINGEELAKLLYAFNFLQDHRGQSGAGTVMVNSKRIKGPLKDRGPTRGATPFNRIKEMSDHTVFAGIGHTCYSRYKFLERRNIHPMKVDSKKYEIYVSSDGILLDKKLRKQWLENAGYSFDSETNGAVIGTMFSRYLDEIEDSGNLTETEKIYEAGRRVIEEICGSGGFSTVMLIRSKKDGRTRLVAIKDKTANKPLCYGEKDDTFFVASETYPLKYFGVESIQRVRGGDVIVFSEDGIEKKCFGKSDLEKPCIFEIIYFGGPEAEVLETLGPDFPDLAKRLGRKMEPGYIPTNYTVRNCLGLAWHDYWKDDVPEPDLISPVVDSGKGVTKGIASGFKIGIDKYDESIIKTPAFRTFQIPNPEERWFENLLKYKLIYDTFKGRILIGDDSIVKGGVSGRSAYVEPYEASFFPKKKYGIIGMLKNIAEVDSITMAVSFGPMFCQCFYDFDSMEDYAAQRSMGKDLIKVCDDVSKILEPDWKNSRMLKVRYNSPETIYGICGRDYCTACMDGKYPVHENFISDAIKSRRDNQKSL